MKYRASISNTFFSRSCIKTYFTFFDFNTPHIPSIDISIFKIENILWFCIFGRQFILKLIKRHNWDAIFITYFSVWQCF